MTTFNMRRRYGSDDPAAIRNREKHSKAAESKDAMRRQRMQEMKDRIRLTGSFHQREALKVAEKGFGWRAVALASWGELTDHDAKILVGWQE